MRLRSSEAGHEIGLGEVNVSDSLASYVGIFQLCIPQSSNSIFFYLSPGKKHRDLVQDIKNT